MGMLRMFGLLFFTVILVGGCVMAVSAPPPSGPDLEAPRDVSLDSAYRQKSHDALIMRYQHSLRRIPVRVYDLVKRLQKSLQDYLAFDIHMPVEIYRLASLENWS